MDAVSRLSRATDFTFGSADTYGASARWAICVATSSDSKTGGGRFLGGAADQAHDPSDSWCRTKWPAICFNSSAESEVCSGTACAMTARYRAGVFTMLQPGRVSRGLSMSLSRSLVHEVMSARVSAFTG